MKKFFLLNYKEDTGKSKAPLEEMQESIKPNHPETNTSEGGEFLDDAIRMHEQPFLGTGMGEDHNTE